MRVLVDGMPGTTLPVWDRGFGYGDGLFETVLVREGKPCQWPRHLARLAAGCLRLGLPPPPDALLDAEARLLLDGSREGVLKVLVTRGTGGRGYRPPPLPRPSRVLLLYPPPSYPGDWVTRGVRVRWCRTPASQNRSLAGIKHLNRLDSVLARSEWDDPQVAEGLMMREDGRVVGGTMTNLFLWSGQRLDTPLLDQAGIGGTVRALTFELAARLGITCRESHLTARDLTLARGLFLTNSLIGCWPISDLDSHAYATGELPWPLLQAVTAAARTAEWSTR